MVLPRTASSSVPLDYPVEGTPSGVIVEGPLAQEPVHEIDLPQEVEGYTLLLNGHELEGPVQLPPTLNFHVHKRHIRMDHSGYAPAGLDFNDEPPIVVADEGPPVCS